MINFPINAFLSSCLAGLKQQLLIRKPWSVPDFLSPISGSARTGGSVIHHVPGAEPIQLNIVAIELNDTMFGKKG